ncbi:SpoIIE family protein phosphatase [Actinacidiphila yeochonensis]|uniref:SpoIIE family protein phosphatase n=1 Tax=Actinacidiphila yeochonensis TaxID=89050 RepID=UPI00099CEF48|nr:SpoIIE family protein phosphatase [Actinacidiphila yeochonensis]
MTASNHTGRARYDPRTGASASGRPVPPDTAPGERLALTGMGSFDWDLDQGVIDLDEAGLRVFDLRREEFNGRPDALVTRVTREEGDRLDRVVRQAVQSGGRTYGAYFLITRRDGVRQWTHTQGTVVRDATGHASRVVGIVRDATAELSQLPGGVSGEGGTDAATLPGGSGTQRAGFLATPFPTAVARTTEALSHAVTVEDVTAVLAGSGGLERFGADGLALSLVEGTAMRFVAANGELAERMMPLEPVRLETALPLADSVLHQRPHFFADPDELRERFPLMLSFLERSSSVGSAAFLPLIAQARSVGGLALFYRGRVPFTREQRELAVVIAGIVAQSLQRAVLFDQEREFATGLQAAMLPRHIPRFEGAEIAVRYHAASVGREVGGDWYDVVALPQNRVGLVVGDVQGHDTHAAAVMGQLRIALRAYAAEGHPPSTVLARASHFLAELDTERFATCSYAQVDLTTGTVHTARAGHLGPLVRHTDGRTGWPNVRGGLPLGLAEPLDQPEFPETRLDLVPGETLVFCTDGLVEERDTDITVGMEALAEAVHRGPQRVEELADHLAESLWRRWGSNDDVALLVLRRTPDPGTSRAPRVHQYVHQADPEGLADARLALRQALTAWHLDEFADDVELAAGELLVNVLLHTEGGAVLTLEVLPEPERRVRLSVQDRSSVWPRRRSPGEAATSGRGLLMIDALAAAWGVEPRGDGKAVWCEFGPARAGAAPAEGRTTAGPDGAGAAPDAA